MITGSGNQGSRWILEQVKTGYVKAYMITNQECHYWTVQWVSDLRETLVGGTMQCAHHRKYVILANFLHSRQHKTYQRILGTQEQTPVGSKDSMHWSYKGLYRVQGPIIGSYNFRSFCRLWIHYLEFKFSSPSNCLAIGLLYHKSGDPPGTFWAQKGPSNGPWEAYIRGPLM